MVRHLVFRCAQCRATTGVQVEWHDGKPAAVACSSCNATYSLKPELNRGWSDQEYRDRVRTYAREQNIDAASACSVLEGIMPREHVRTVQHAAPEAARQRPSAFRAIFGLALLLVLVAFVAGRLVGDRRTTSAPGFAGAPPTASAGPALPPSRPAGRSGWIVCQVDGGQTITKLSGPDARTVLEALLDQPVYAGNLVPYGLAPADGSGVASKVGVARDRMDPTRMLAVRLWSDREGRWVAGDGSGPVRLDPIDSAPDGFEAF